MTTERRRRLRALGLFLATAIGGLVAYLLSRRARRARKPAPEEASLDDLSARLRRAAATQEQRMRRRPPRLRWRIGGARRPKAVPQPAPEEALHAPAPADRADAAEVPPSTPPTAGDDTQEVSR